MGQNERTFKSSGKRPRTRLLRAGLHALAVGALGMAPHARGVEPTAPPDPTAELISSMDPAADPFEGRGALSYFKSLQWEDFTLSGYLASRKPQAPFTTELFQPPQDEAVDYRTYLGLRFMRSLNESVQLSGHTFYGAGTYDGDNSYIDPEGGAVPEEVRASGRPVGEWLGTDWRVSSRLSDRHSFQAGIEYRQQLGLDLFHQDKLFGKSSVTDGAELARRIDVVARSELALARDLWLKAGFRYDEGTEAHRATIDPRVELRYKPLKNATLSAVFDQAVDAPISVERAYHPLARISQDSNRIRNYTVAYEQALTSRDQLRLSAYRYGVDGLLADPVEPIVAEAEPDARVDAKGFEVGMERHQPSGARTSISYAWQETTNTVVGTSQSSVGRRLAKLKLGFPIWARRFTSAFELQYHDIVSSLIGDGDYNYYVGNLTLASGDLAQDTSVSIGVRDVFGAHDEPVGPLFLPFVPPDGRSVRVDLKRKF